LLEFDEQEDEEEFDVTYALRARSVLFDLVDFLAVCSLRFGSGATLLTALLIALAVVCDIPNRPFKHNNEIYCKINNKNE